MRTRETNFNRFLFGALILGLALLIIAGTLAPLWLKIAISALDHLLFSTDLLGWIIVLGTLALIGLVVAGVLALVYREVRRLNDSDWPVEDAT